MDIFHIDPRMLSLLQQGSDAVRDLRKQTQRHGVLTDAQIARATELEHAYIGLRQSVTGVTNELGDQMSRWMTPMLTKWSEWLDRLRESPGAMKAVETGAEGLAAVFGVTLFAGVAKLIGKLNAFWALPAIKFLVANPWLSGLIAGGAVLWPTPLNEGEDAYIKAHPELFPQMPVKGSWFGNSPGWVDESDSGLQANGNPVAGNPGIALPIPRNSPEFGKFYNVTAPNGRTYRLQQTDVGPDPSTGRGVDINSAAAAMMGYTPQNFPTNGLFRVAPAIGGGANAGDISHLVGNPNSPGWADKNLTTVTTPSGKTFRVNKWAAPAFSGFLADLEASGYPINQQQSGGFNLRDIVGSPGVLSQHAFGNAIDINADRNPLGGAASDLPANISEMAARRGLNWGGDWATRKDPMHFEWSGQYTPAMAPAIPTAAEPIGGASGTGPQSSLDSSHHVIVDFRGAPPGTRTELARADGPATAAVRVQYSMTDPS
jgi:D-alanyl-D-alanine carboxypeptidase